MNYRKGIIINIIVLLSVLASLLILYFSGSGSLEKPAPQEKSIFRYDVSDIAAVAIINETSRFGLIHDGTKIQLEPRKEGASYSEQEMQSFLYRISKLDYQNTINHNQELESLGLESPLSHGTIILSSGEKVRFSMGNQNQMDGSYYFMKEGDEHVFLVAESDAQLFLSQPNDFMTRQILPKIDLKDLNILKEISMSFPNQDLPSFRIINEGNFIFNLADPYRNSLDYESVLSKLIFPTLSISPDRKLTDNEKSQLPSKADILLKVSLEEQTHTLTFYKNSDRSYYLTSTDIPGVFEIDEDSLPFKSLHYLDLMDESVYHTNISEIKSIRIEESQTDIDYNIELSGESINLKGLINGVSVDYPRMMDFYEILFKTSIARELLGEHLPDTNNLEPSLTISIYKKTGSIDRLDFFKTKENEQFLFVNGEANFTSYNMTVLEIQRKLLELTAGDHM